MKGKSYTFHRLKDLRQDKDISQTEVAKVINTTQSYYAQYERGERPITLERALQIADFYGVSLDYIAGRTNSKKISTDLVVNPSKSTIASGEPQKTIKTEKTATPKDPHRR